jgi:ferredoxin-NADP reductase/DMSO/TMAO reductase YedYZ heme-binding membrane subunit
VTIVAAWGLAVVTLTVGTFALDHSSPLNWSGPTLLLTLGRFAGLMAGQLLLLQLVLAARPRTLERRRGVDGLLRAHATNGVVLTVVVGLHISLLVLGGTLLTGTAPLEYAWQLVGASTPVLLAVAGLAGLVLLLVTTAWRALRERHREVWHAVHLLGYPAAVLVVPHQVLTGTQFLAHPALSAVWLGTWGAALLIAGYERVVRVAMTARRHPLTVAAVEPEGPRTVSLVLRSPEPLPDVEPGGFVLLGANDWQGHPFSVVQRPDERSVRCTVRAVGDFTGRLVSLHPGDRLTLTGVHGRFTAPHAVTHGPYLLIAGGLGITAVRGLLDGFLTKSPAADVVLLYRARAVEDVLYGCELAAARRRGVDVRVLVGSRDDVGVRASTPEDLVTLVPDAANREWFVCGPEGHMAAVRRAARQLGVPRARFHAERFTFGR